jgi:hypothetical protein
MKCLMKILNLNKAERKIKRILIERLKIEIRESNLRIFNLKVKALKKFYLRVYLA